MAREHFGANLSHLKKFGLNPEDYALVESRVVGKGLELLQDLNDASEFSDHVAKMSGKEIEEIHQYLENFPVDFTPKRVVILNGEVLNKNEFIHILLKNNPFLKEVIELIPEERRHEKIELLVLNHLNANDSNGREDFARRMLKEFPEYSYAGTAYRAVLIDYSGTQNFYPEKVLPGSSWAMTPEGLQKFLDNSYYYEAVRLEGNILGLNFVRLLKEKFSSLLEEHAGFQVYVPEDEIIATEIISFDVKGWI